jgi:hypothetical protein
MHSPSDPDAPLLPAAGRPEVPVFDCRVLIKRLGDAGPFQARAATLPNLQVQAATQREALQALVRTFKMTVAGYYERGEVVPWLDPPLEPEVDEQMLWLPVHL